MQLSVLLHDEAREQCKRVREKKRRNVRNVLFIVQMQVFADLVGVDIEVIDNERDG